MVLVIIVRFNFLGLTYTVLYFTVFPKSHHQLSLQPIRTDGREYLTRGVTLNGQLIDHQINQNLF